MLWSMKYKYTKVPNVILDNHLRTLSPVELKLLLVVVRQTIGWKKPKDRISHAQFIKKTGISRKVISKTIQSLINKHLIEITDFNGNQLNTPQKRKGKLYLYYSFIGLEHVHSTASTCAQNTTAPVHSKPHNKRKYTKENKTKESTMKSIGELLQKININQ